MAVRLAVLPLLAAGLLFSCQTARHAAGRTDAAATAREKGKAAESVPDYYKERRYNELFLEAVRQKEAERVDAQYELLDAALRLMPRAPEALYEMAMLKLSYSAYSDSVSRAQGDSLLWEAVRLAPDNLYYKESLATHLANNAKFRDAILLYEEIADAKNTEETLTTLIWLYEQSGDYPGAIRAIERLERLSGRSEALSLEKFQTYLAMRDDEHAYQAIEDLCAEYPLDLRYRVLLGDLYDQHGYHERALDTYRDVLAAEPDNSYAQLSLLAYYKAAGADSLYNALLDDVVLNPRTQSAARIEAMKSFVVDNVSRGTGGEEVATLFRKALARPQETGEMATLYAAYLVSTNAPQDSVVSALQRILSIEPDNSTARLQWLQIALQRNNMQEAAQICKDGVLYDPSEITYYYYEGTALYRLGRDGEAVATLQRGAGRIDDDTDPRLSSDLLAQLGDVLHDLGRDEEAYAAYDRSLEFNPANLTCLNNYAYFLSLSGTRLDKAEEMSRRTVAAEGDNATYLDTYAWILFQKKQYAKARAYIDETLRYAGDTPEDASLYEHAGDIYLRVAGYKAAAAHWRKALNLTNDAKQRTRLRRKLYRRR